MVFNVLCEGLSHSFLFNGHASDVATNISERVDIEGNRPGNSYGFAVVSRES